MNSPRLRTLLALLVAPVVAAACEDPFDDGARLPNIDVVIESWALTGSPPSFPTALLVPQYTVIRADAAGSFDIAFDINAEGRLVVLPVSRVVSPVTGSRSIGLLRSFDNYSTIIEAPRTGWVYDSALVVNPGDAFLVRVQTLYCQFELRQDVYAKFYVDSVIPDERRVKLFSRINPNCGFRSFLDGIPEY